MSGDPNPAMAAARALQFPIVAAEVLRKRRAIKNELAARPHPLAVRIAILGGSTTSELRSMLELFLLARGIAPVFYESEYNRYYEDAVFRNPRLWDFRPAIVFLHTTWRNVTQFPGLLAEESAVEQLVESEMARFEKIWERIHGELGALIVQNNFDLPRVRPLGNLEAAECFGRVHFLERLNARFAACARGRSHLLINDIHYLSAEVGLAQWHSETYWYRFHMAVSPVATVALAQNAAAIMQAAYGKSRKCLVLDLDNTLWGGVIGDDGVEGILLGPDHPVGEAFADFQRYVKGLKARGILLAVCSKNDAANAIEGFSHPDSILRREDFSAFYANWDPKPENIRRIAAELNIGCDSMVFVDDNPAERELVARELPQVAVPNVGSDVARFAEALEQERFFEPVKIVADDLHRASFYQANAERKASEAQAVDYGEFLSSLGMSAEIGPFLPIYIERITQLINKTNQFNLTTRRYTPAEVEAIGRNAGYVALSGRLADRLGDSGLVSVIIGRVSGDALEIDLWVMSCRVFRREMEFAMFDALVEECQARGIGRIAGTYIPSPKNGVVTGHYAGLGFRRQPGAGEHERWEFEVRADYSPLTRHIRRAAALTMTTA